MSLAAFERLAQAMRLPSPLEPLSDDGLRASGVELWLKRDDLIHPDVPGNKWRKLKHNLMEAPEGGSNDLAVRGCAEIPAEIDIDYDVICCPCGTGTTLAGIAAGLNAGKRAIGFSALKGGDFLTHDVTDLQQSAYGYCSANWHIERGFHFGRFAKRNAELGEFLKDFARRHDIALDWVYVAKMMYGLYSLAIEGVFIPGTRVIAVITGPPFEPFSGCGAQPDHVGSLNPQASDRLGRPCRSHRGDSKGQGSNSNASV